LGKGEAKVKTWLKRVGRVALMVLLLLISGLATKSLAQVAEPTPTPVVEQSGFGRVIEASWLVTDPNGSEITQVQRGAEFSVLQWRELSRNRSVWYQVELLANGQRGWLTNESIELALMGTETLRLYEGGVCMATPIEAERLTNADVLSGYQHQLVFEPTEVAIEIIDEFYLIFNGEVRDLDVEISQSANSIRLPAFWVLRHSGFAPRWSAETYWQLQWQCRAAE
jgi:hypothetical protein